MSGNVKFQLPEKPTSSTKPKPQPPPSKAVPKPRPPATLNYSPDIAIPTNKPVRVVLYASFKALAALYPQIKFDTFPHPEYAYKANPAMDRLVHQAHARFFGAKPKTMRLAYYAGNVDPKKTGKINFPWRIPGGYAEWHGNVVVFDVGVDLLKEKTDPETVVLKVERSSLTGNVKMTRAPYQHGYLHEWVRDTDGGFLGNKFDFRQEVARERGKPNVTYIPTRIPGTGHRNDCPARRGDVCFVSCCMDL